VAVMTTRNQQVPAVVPPLAAKLVSLLRSETDYQNRATPPPAGCGPGVQQERPSHYSCWRHITVTIIVS
jgi:hypothetical protein